MQEQQKFLREVLSQEGQRAVGFLFSDSETDHDEDSQLDFSLPAPPVSSDNNAQQSVSNACAPNNNIDAQQQSPSSLPNEPAEGSKRSKHSKLEPCELGKAARFRKAVVCFRCKVGKGGVCAREFPLLCIPCKRSKDATTGRPSLRQWMLCVAFAFGDFDVFAIEFPCPEEKFISILQKSDRIVAEDLEIAIEVYDCDDIIALCQEFARSLCKGTKSAALLGLLASSRFQRLVSPLVNDDVGKYTRLLMEITIALRSVGQVTQYLGYSIDELRHLQSFAGTRAIQGLGAALRNPFDKALLADKGRALFLTLFGVITAVATYRRQSAGHQMTASSSLAGESQVHAYHQLLGSLTHHMIYIADLLKLLPEHMARDRIAKDPDNELSTRLRFCEIKHQSLYTVQVDEQNQHTKAENTKLAERPRQLIVANDDDELLPLEQCGSCNNMKRWINLRDGICSECLVEAKVEAFLTHGLSHHFRSITKIMVREDWASYPIAAESDQPQEPSIPIWEQCVWCESISGSDGLCDLHRASDDRDYDVEHTNFPPQLWSDLLAEAGSHLG